MLNHANIFSVALPQDLQPIPKVAFGAQRPRRKRGKTAIITSTPFKLELETSFKNKCEKPRASVKRQIGDVERNSKKKP